MMLENRTFARATRLRRKQFIPAANLCYHHERIFWIFPKIESGKLEIEKQPSICVRASKIRLDLLAAQAANKI